MKPENFPVFRNPNVIIQFLGFSQEMRAIWLPSMAFAFLVSNISVNENEDPNVVERRYLELTGLALGLPKADILAVINYLQDDRDQCQN